MTEGREREIYTTLLASKCLLQIIAREFAQTAQSPYGTGILRIDRVILISCITDVGRSCKLNLIVLEVCLLDNYFGSVGEGKLLETQLLVLLSILDFACLRCLSHQRLLLHIVHISLKLLAAHLLHDVGKFLFGRINGTLCLVHEHHAYKVGIGSTDQLLHGTVNHIYRKAWHDHLIDLSFILYRRNWLVRDEMVNILSGKLLILHLGTVLVSLVNMTHEFVLGTLIFRSRKAEIMHALSFAHQGSICLLHLARLSHAYH